MFDDGRGKRRTEKGETLVSLENLSSGALPFFYTFPVKLIHSIAFDEVIKKSCQTVMADSFFSIIIKFFYKSTFFIFGTRKCMITQAVR